MERFVFKIPSSKVSRHNDPVNTLSSIGYELRRMPGVTDDEWDSDFIGLTVDCSNGVKHLSVYPNYGIRNQLIRPSLKKSFREAMPKIIDMIPGMEHPFVGKIEFHSVRSVLKAVHFIQHSNQKP